MRAKTEAKANTVKILPAKGSASNDVKNYENDPMVIKKLAAAMKRIERVGFPDTFVK